MPRIRKSTEPEAKTKRQKIWKVGKYIRLSREDGNVISESVVNQDKILQDEIPNFFEDGLKLSTRTLMTVPAEQRTSNAALFSAWYVT